MNPVRSALAVLAGVMLLGFIDQTLERTLVSAIADAPPTDEASYLAVRNRPLVLVVTLVAHGFAAMLAGYILAKIAGAYETRHAIAAAAVLTVAYAFAFLSDNAMLPPVWVRVAILFVTPAALLAGATVRAQARTIQAEQVGTPHREGTP
jgi:hypothetical protein